MKHLASLIAFKDKVLVIFLAPVLFVAELIFKCMHYTTHCRLKSAIANRMGKNAYWVHHKHTGEDIMKAARDAAEKERHKKFKKKQPEFKTP